MLKSGKRLTTVFGILFGTRALVFGALLLFAGSAVFLALRLHGASAGFFPVKEVFFYGNRHLSEGELLTMSGVTRDEGLIGLSTKGIAERLMKSPWIKSISIRKDFPNSVLIRIAEATPFAILEMKGHAFLVDEGGKMLEETKGAVPFLPVIAADPFRNRDNFVEAIALARLLKEKKIAAERNRVEIVADKTPEEISMIIDNVVIKIGQGDYERKLQRLFSLEDEIKKRAIPVDYVDLRFANRIVVKPISEVVR